MDADISVRGDSDRLRQIVTNLLSNAANFSSEGDNVQFTVTRDNETARVSIADKGLGIPADRSEHIFDKFT
jgi:signal transduction histidine kinase